jgi:hypothetical protein
MSTWKISGYFLLNIKKIVTTWTLHLLINIKIKQILFKYQISKVDLFIKLNNFQAKKE